MSRHDTAPVASTRVDTIRQKFDRYKKAWSPIHEQLDADMKCLSEEGPWPDKERKARETPGNERPCLHEDVITQFNNMTKAELEMNPMGIDVQPEGDGADEDTSEYVENRIRQIEYEQNGQHAYLTAGHCAIDGSIGYWELETEDVHWSTWPQRIAICPILDPKSVLVDPNCKKPDWSDMQGAFKLSRLSHDEFRQKYPDAKIQDFNGFIGKESYSDWVNGQTVQIAAFWEVVKKQGKLILFDDGTPEGWTVFEYQGKLYDARDGAPDLKREMPMLRRVGKVIKLTVDVEEYAKNQEFPILRESKRYVPRVTKCLTNGIEILEETPWEDEEIPIMVVTGRVKFEDGKRVIDSQTRKGRTGQMLYDLTISSIWEEAARTPKFLWLGYEGQFDTITNWKTVHREPSAYAEAKATTEEVGDGKPLPLPEMVRAEPQIAALLELKISIMLSIQNALGVSATERKDRAAKSGKALEQLAEDQQKSSSHYRHSLNMAQLRQYRIINRLLPKVENTAREVGLRDIKGNYKTQQIPADHYQSIGRHEVVISSTKYHASLQEKQVDFATSLIAGIKDTSIMLAILPDIVRAQGLGPHWDTVAKMIESIQPPQMQQARNEDEQMNPAMLQQAAQQAQQAVQALNAKVEEVERERDELKFEQMAKKVEASARLEEKKLDNAVKIDVALIQASVKERMDALDAQIAYIKHMADTLTERFGMAHDATQRQRDREHASSEAGIDRTMQVEQSERDRQHGAEQAERDRMATAAQETV